ncbi:MAG TPA: PqqD family protein [Candidatus Binataceae bacterium]|nr:PqqD family protein [Candidatus Binataceae bacterium]
MDGPSRRNPVTIPGLEINAVADGYIVYQSDLDRVHYLNQTAALILEMCNGRNAEEDMPELLRTAYDLPTAPIEEVADCLAALKREGLIS